MPETFTFDEVLEPESFSFEDLQEVTPVGSSGMGDLKMAEREQDKGIRRDALLQEKKRADFNSAFDADNLRAIEIGEQMVKPYASPIKSLIHGTRQLVGLEDPNNPLPIVAPIPRTTPELIRGMAPHLIPKGAAEVAAGAQQAAAGLGDFMLDPDYIALGGVGAVRKAIQGTAGSVFTADMASHLPEQAKNLSEAVKTGGTADITREYLNTALTALGTAAPVAHSLLPKSAKTVEETIKFEDISDAQKGLNELNEKAPELKPERKKAPGEIEVPDEAFEFEVVQDGKTPREFGQLKELIEERKKEEAQKAVEATTSPDIANNAQRPSDLLASDTVRDGGIQGAAREPEIIGMGGAVPGEFTPPKQFDTSIKNAQVDAERKELGLPPAMEPLKRSFDTVWKEAMDVVENDPKTQDKLIQDLRDNPRPLTDLEDALLLHRQADLKTEQVKIAREMEQAFNDGRTEDVALKQAEFERLTTDIQEIYDMGKSSGTANARGLNARKMAIDQDFSLSNLVMEMQAKKGGKKLTTQETLEVQKIADEYKSKVEAAEKSLAEKDQRIADLEAQKAFERIKAETKPSNYVIQVVEKIGKALEKRATQAEKDLRAIFARTSTGVDPTILVKVTEIAAHHIFKNGLDFAKWSIEAVDKFGDVVKPYLKESWENAQKLIENQAVKFGGGKRSKEVTETIKKTEPKNRIEGAKVRVAKGEKVDLGMLAHQLARDFVKQGVKTRDELINLLHPALQQIDPKITRLETAHAVSGYGKFKKLSREEVDVTLRDLKGQLQQISKLEDMQAGKAPEKTGVERRTPSDEERRLIKQVEEAKRKGGYKVTDPATQLKSALDAVKTRLRNAITDLETQIESKTKIVKKKNRFKIRR